MFVCLFFSPPDREAQEAQDRREGKPEKKKRKINRKKNAITPANSAGESNFCT
jgi:hypothetical protein